jgi:hypothetical protein
MLISGTEAIDMARRIRGRGVTGELGISWPELIAFKRTFTDPVPQKQEHRLAERGIDAFHGKARFTGQTTIEIDGQILQARHVLIANGARPVPLTFPGAESRGVKFSPDSPLEGTGFEPLVPLLRKGFSAVAERRCRADKLDGVIKHRSSRETTVVGRGPPLHGRLFDGGTDGSNPSSSCKESCANHLRATGAPNAP